MGTFALMHSDGPRLIQLVASSVKVPALFLLTLLVTFPSLYVFNALVGSQLRILANLRLLVASLAVTLAVLASLGPIIAFFSVSTTSYPFMKVLNVIAFGIAGGLGLMFFLQTLHRMTLAESGITPAPCRQRTNSILSTRGFVPAAGKPHRRRAGLPAGSHVKTVFRCWSIVFGLVGRRWPGSCGRSSAVRTSRSRGFAHGSRISSKTWLTCGI